MISTLRIALCDDEPSQLAEIRTLLEEYLSRHPDLDARISAFTSPRALLDRVLLDGGFQLYILDVIMPEKGGIQLGTELRRLDGEAVLIYLTTSPDFAVDSYLVRAFHYLLKPVRPQQLWDALDDAMARMASGHAANVMLKTRDGLIRLPLCSILCAELAGRCVRYSLADGGSAEGAALRGSFRGAVAPLLKDRRFVLCGSSFAVNLQFVRALERNDAVLTNGRRIPISRAFLGEVKNRWMDYWLEEGR